MHWRKIPRSLGTLFLLSWLLSTAFSAEKVRVGTSTKVNPQYNLLMMAAEDQGFWKANGLEAEWFPFSAGGALARGFAARSVDMAVQDGAFAIDVIARGLPLVIVAELQAGQFIMKNKKWTLDKLMASFGYSRPAAELAYPELRYGKEGKIDPRAIENVRNFLTEYGAIAKELFLLRSYFGEGKAPATGELYSLEFGD